MKKILSILVCLIVMITLVIPKTEVNAKGEYFEHAKTLHFKDDVERSQASTRVQYSLVSIPLEDGTRVPGIEYVFTFNPEYNELPGSIWTAGQKIGFILPYAVGVPTKIVKTKSWKTGGVDAVPDVKRYEGRHILVDWLSNQDSQDYASKLTKEEFRVGHVFSEAYKDQKNSNKDIDLFDDRYKSYVLKGYENEARTSSKSATDIQGFNNLKNYLDSKEGANQMFASWETANSDYKFTFVVEAPLRDPQNPTDIIRDVNRISEVAEKDLQAYAFISSDNKSLVHMYRVNGVSATINDLQNSKGGVVNGVPVHDGIADSNRNQLSEIKKLSVINAPALTYTDTPFNDDEIKNKVLVHGGGEKAKNVIQKPEYTKQGGGEATVEIVYPDNSTETIKVPTLSIDRNNQLGNPAHNQWTTETNKKISHLQNPETKFKVLKIEDNKMLKGIVDEFNSIKDKIEDRYQKLGEATINKDIKPLLDKIEEWESKIKKFKSDYRDILNSTSPEYKDKEKINKALSELKGFDQQVQEALKKEEEKLKKDLEILDTIEKNAEKFKEDNKDKSDKEALDEYKKLKTQEKEALAQKDKSLSDKLKQAEAEEIKKENQAEAEKFKTDNKDLLDKKLEDITKDDEQKIKELAEKYNDLNSSTKDLLDNEEEKINKLLEKIEELKNPVEAFKKKYKDLIEKKPESVDQENIDQTIEQIDKALEEISKLEEKDRSKLETENSKLTDLKTKLNEKKQPEGNTNNNQGNHSDVPQAETKQEKDLYPPTLKELTVLQHSVLTQDMIKEKVELPKEAIDNKAVVSVIDNQDLSTKEVGEKQIQIRVFYGDSSSYVGNVKVVVKEVSVSSNPITIKKGQELSDETLKNSVVIKPELVGTTKTVKERVDTNKVGSQNAKVTITYPNGDTQDVNVVVNVEENDVTSNNQTKPQAPEVSAKEDGSVTITPKDSNTIDTITITYTPEGETNEKTITIKKDSKDNNKWKLEGNNPGINIDEKTGKVTIPADKVKDNTKVVAIVKKGNTSSETSTDTSKVIKQETPNTNQGSNGNTNTPSNPSNSNNQTKPQANYLSDKNTGIKAIHDSYKDDEYELIIERKPNIKPTNLNNNQGIEVYDIKVRHKTTKQLVTNFNPALKIYVPTTNKIIKVVHISDNDHKIQDQTYNFTKQDQGIQFSTNHLSLYGLVYENSKPKQTVTHNPNWQQDLRKHNEFISKHNKETNKTLPNTGHINNHSILLASTLLTLVAYKLYKKED